MTPTDPSCVSPPAPALLDRIVRTHEAMAAGERLDATQIDVLDLRTYAAIASRPVASRAHTLLRRVRPSLAPTTGTVKALVILVDFADNMATQSQQHYDDMLFSAGTYPTGSMRDFYQESSYGQLDVTGAVAGQGGPTSGWCRAPRQYSYYTNGNFGFGAHPQNAQGLVEDVVDAANPIVDFANYDNDNDGLVDALFIVHAGPGGEATGNVNDIWSHQWAITPRTVDNVQVSTYSMEPEDGNIGVFCHELGHVLGLPDLYDIDYTSAGTGRWDVMSGGSWNNGGVTPCHFGPWCKLKLGWITPIAPTGGHQSITLQPLTDHPEVYRLAIGTSGNEYFLLANRQRTGFDSYLPGDGLMIQHCDDNLTSNTDENHYLVDIEQCDGNHDLNANANQGDATDMFPTPVNAEFTDTSNPSSKAYDGSSSQVSITNVQRSGQNITADLSAGGAAVTGWLFDRTISAVFVHHSTQWAWAHIDALGWRRIKDGAADGVTNVFAACSDAAANNRAVHVYVDTDFLYTMYAV